MSALVPSRVPCAAETGDPYARKLRSELAAHVRHGNTEAAAAARRKLAVHQLGKHIREAVPVLSPDDAAMLRGLLSSDASSVVSDGRKAVAA